MEDDVRKQIVKAYFDALAAKDVSRVPWAEDAALRTPLNPAGGEGALIRGRKAILEFFTGVLPAVRSVKFMRCYLSDIEWAAGQAEIGLANGKTLYALDAFRIDNREIQEQQTITIHGRRLDSRGPRGWSSCSIPRVGAPFGPRIRKATR